MTATPPPSRTRPSRQTILIALVVVIGILLGVLILSITPDTPAQDDHDHDHPASPANTSEAVRGKTSADKAAADDHAHAVEDAHDHDEDQNHAHEADHPDQAEHEEAIVLSAQQIQQSGLQLATAGPAAIAHTLQLPGEVRLNQDRSVQIVPRLAGVVEAAPVSAGDQVRKGQVLAVLSSQSLAGQRSLLLAAQQRLALARRVHDREKDLWQEKISAEQDYLQARTSLEEARIAVRAAEQTLSALGSPAGKTLGTAALTRHEIRAPIAGVIIDKQLTVGQVVQADAPVFIVADLSSVWIEMTVRAQDLGTVRTGQVATVSSSAFNASGSAKVRYLSALVGEQTRTAMARLELPNPDGLWRPGLPVNVTLTTDTTQVPVAVASTALQTLDEQAVVFVRTETGFLARPVVTGRSDGNWTEIRQGLQANESYAATNSFLLKAELGKASASHEH